MALLGKCAKLGSRKIKLIADELIKTAAERAMRDGEVMTPDIGLYDEFAARFPYEETEDQIDAIEAVIDDLASGRPMDRLICGDVGFGKTEVGLRAAFIAAMSGKQVAVVAPTTLLARQHAKTFKERFAGMPVEIAELSRLVGTAKPLRPKRTEVRRRRYSHRHACIIGKNIEFSRLGLVIVDEAAFRRGA